MREKITLYVQKCLEVFKNTTTFVSGHFLKQLVAGDLRLLRQLFWCWKIVGFLLKTCILEYHISRTQKEINDWSTQWQEYIISNSKSSRFKVEIYLQCKRNITRCIAQITNKAMHMVLVLTVGAGQPVTINWKPKQDCKSIQHALIISHEPHRWQHSAKMFLTHLSKIGKGRPFNKCNLFYSMSNSLMFQGPWSCVVYRVSTVPY